MKYSVELTTIYGTLLVDDIEADTQEDAIQFARFAAEQAVDHSSVGEIREYDTWHSGYRPTDADVYEVMFSSGHISLAYFDGESWAGELAVVKWR